MAQTEAILAQYKYLTDEIKSIGLFIERTATVTVTVTTGLVGLALSTGKWALFLCPFLMQVPSLALILSQLDGAVRAATYIKVFIEPEIPGLKWESRLMIFRITVPRYHTGIGFVAFYFAMAAVPLLLAWIYLDSYTVRNVLLLSVVSAGILGVIAPAILWGRRYFRPDVYTRYCQRWERIAAQERAPGDNTQRTSGP